MIKDLKGNVMKEYGGYIEFEINHGFEYYEELVKLNCGRNCLAYLIELKDIKEIYMPYFLCDSVRETCKKYGVICRYYHIDEYFRPIINFDLDDKTFFYVVNYYGQLADDYILQLKKDYANIIIDNVQAFFSKPIYGCDTLYSCRKYFGVTDGGYLFTNNHALKEYPKDISYERIRFLLGRFEKTASEFYQEYQDNNNLFDDEPIKLMSKLTSNLLKGIDYASVKDRRENNFRYLHSRMNQHNKLALEMPEGPFAYPLLVDKGNQLRSLLQKEKVYIPMLWPDVMETCDCSTLEYKYADNILPLPVDQRYGEKDMEYICQLIERII